MKLREGNQILAVNSFLAYLLASVMDTSAGLSKVKATKIPGAQPMLSKALHESIKFVHRNLRIIAKSWLGVIAWDKKYPCHHVIAFYVEVVPAMKNLLSIEHGVLTMRPCPRCVVRKENLSSTADYPV